MDLGDLLKVSGPLAIGWLVAGYLIKWILDRLDKDMESRTRLAAALEALTKAVEDNGK